MPFMVTNVKLREVVSADAVLTPEEIKALAAEVLRNRKFIRGAIELFKLRNA